jgi:hypothetical protein
VKLREVSYGFCRWPVEVLFELQGNMYLDTGFEKFARADSLEVGCLLHLLSEGDGVMSDRVFDDSSFAGTTTTTTPAMATTTTAAATNTCRF